MNFVNVAVSGRARVPTRQPNARALHFSREGRVCVHTYTHSRMHRTFLKERSISGMLSISGGFCRGKFLRARCLRWKQNIYYWTPFVLLVFVIYSFSQMTKMLLVHSKKSHGIKNDKTEAVRSHLWFYNTEYFSFLVSHFLPQIPSQPAIDLKPLAKPKNSCENGSSHLATFNDTLFETTD